MGELGLTGLMGLAEYQRVIDEDSQATPEQRSGGPADQRHGNWGEQAAPYPWESSLSLGGSHGPYGPENQLLGDEWWLTTPAGQESDDITFDRTPSKRAGPFPKGVASGPVPGATPDDIAEQLRQSAAIHSIQTGAGLKALYPVQGLGVQQDEWQEIWYVDPGNSDLVQVPNQMKSSGFLWGTTDRTQSFAHQNDHGFGSKHMKRRFATGSIPGNTDWMRPGGRPLQKSLPGPSRPPIGVDSPFHGDDLGAAFGVQGAVLQNMPTEYVPPPQPNLAAAYPVESGLEPVVEWY